jgi:hypothetical protein
MKTLRAGAVMAAVFAMTASATQEGYFRDVFWDAGPGLSSLTKFTAGEELDLDVEYFAHDDVELSQRRMSYESIDENSCILYPDRQPRYRILYVNGGSGYNGWGDNGKRWMQYFSYNGGCFMGSCWGAMIPCDYWLGIIPHDFNFGRGVDKHDLELNKETRFFREFCGKYEPLADDAWVSQINHYNGPGFSPNLDKLEYLGYHRNTVVATAVEGQANVVAYKGNDQQGRIVVVGSHPEWIMQVNEISMLLMAMTEYALDGIGGPVVKAELTNGEVRTMDDNDREGYEKIGDRQYHHYTIDLPADVPSLTITVAGEKYDFNLFLKHGDFAFRNVADFQAASGGSEQRLTVENPAAGLWYVGVELADEVQTREVTGTKLRYWEYTGNTDVLNGIAYEVEVGWADPVASRIAHARVPSRGFDVRARGMENGDVAFEISTQSTGPYSLSVFDMRGGLLWKQDMTAIQAGTSGHVASRLPRLTAGGQYIVRLNQNGRTASSTFSTMR